MLYTNQKQLSLFRFNLLHSYIVTTIYEKQIERPRLQYTISSM